MTDQNIGSTRRDFFKKSAVVSAAAAAPLVIPRLVHADSPDEIRLGLVGCGGRGTGAVSNSISSSANVKIVAMADLAPDRLEVSRKGLEAKWKEKGKFAVTDDDCFTGVECYKKLCAHPDVDIVIHTTPPGLRYLTLREAINNGKHSFVEKPVCVDPYTYHHVLESGRLASEKGLAIVSGTQYRRETSFQDAIARLHDGSLGELTGGFAYFCVGTLWLRGLEKDWQRWGGVNGMEYQMRNWYYFTWLSGDHITEQAVHNLDVMNWAFGGPPVSAYGSGGRLVRTDPKFGDIYDHFSIDYDYPNGARVSFKCRQFAGAKGRVANRFIGTKGTMDIQPSPGRTSSRIRDAQGKQVWSNRGRNDNSPYEQEHMDLIASIRDGSPIQEIKDVADSSLTAVMGREAAYSGQIVTFDWAANESKMKLSPEKIDLGTNPVRAVPKPGFYQLADL